MRPTMLPSSWAASSLIHASAFGALVLGARSEAPITRPVEVVEFRMDPAPAQPKEPPPPPPVAAPSPAKEAPATTKSRPAATPTRSLEPSPTAPATTDTPPGGPLDFTGSPVGEAGSFTMTAASGGGGGTGGSRVGPVTAPAPAGPRILPREELSRPPSPPDLASRLLANYPSHARESGETGSATLSLVVLADGTVTSLEVRRATSPALGRACLETVRGSRWQSPLDKNGQPTGTRVGYTCTFDVR